MNIFVLSGAGLSKASGVPTFRDADGLWEGHDVADVATPEGWARNPALVRRFYDERRLACHKVEPNAAHHALVRLQREHKGKVILVTQNVDGLLTRAGAQNVEEMHGSLYRIRCSKNVDHPHWDVSGEEWPAELCTCGRPLRPDVVWFGEVPYHMGRIQRAAERADVFVSVGTSGNVYPAAGLVQHARRAVTIEVNPVRTDGSFERYVQEPAEVALPRMVDEFLSGAFDA